MPLHVPYPRQWIVADSLDGGHVSCVSRISGFPKGVGLRRRSNWACARRSPSPSNSPGRASAPWADSKATRRARSARRSSPACGRLAACSGPFSSPDRWGHGGQRTATSRWTVRAIIAITASMEEAAVRARPIASPCCGRGIGLSPPRCASTHHRIAISRAHSAGSRSPGGSG